MRNPLSLGAVSKGITKLHQPLVWENMLGTVFAMNSKLKVEYFDYDYEKALEFAGLDKFTDLRVCKNKFRFTDYRMPRLRQKVLYGVMK